MTNDRPGIKPISVTTDSLRLSLAGPAETEALGALLAGFVARGDCILLRGDLGAGKTTLTRGLIKALAARDGQDDCEVSSPTFPILQTYSFAGLEVHHFDLYRIEDESEVREIGLEDALDSGLTVIEWPDRALPALPARRLEIELRHRDGGREAVLAGGLGAGSIAALWEQV